MRLITKFKNKSFFERKIHRAYITMGVVGNIWRYANIKTVELYGVLPVSQQAEFEVISSKINV